MCIAKVHLRNGQVVSCRKCWQCEAVYVQDITGRAIAEKKTSDKTFVITLTYGGGDRTDAALLNYRNVQLMLKRIRASFKKPTSSLRYIISGEYGSERGRAHWHAILFFKGEHPKFKYETRYNHSIWPEGYIYVEKPTYQNMNYAVKYALKDHAKGPPQFHRSTIPVLGHDFFMREARRYVDQQLTPTDFSYKHQEAKKQNGELRQFMMRGTLKEKFIAEFQRYYKQTGATYMNYSEIYEAWQQKQLDALHIADVKGFHEQLRLKNKYWDEPVPLTVVRAKSSLRHDAQIFQYEDGSWQYAILDREGKIKWQRDVKGVREMRLAVLGELPRKRNPTIDQVKHLATNVANELERRKKQKGGFVKLASRKSESEKR